MYNSNKHTSMSKESDMISDLPDEMIHHVLSFLGIKETVQTILLSKRWVNLWASLPCLNFNPHDFGAVDERQLNIWEKILFGPRFKGFVETVLYRREASFLDTFFVRFPQILDKDACSDLVRTCVSYAMKHNARVFSMEASIPSEELIACLFAWESIEEMCLRTRFWHADIPEVIPETANLPRVRRLKLKKSILDSRIISRLYAGCPKLEELSLESCFGEFSCIFSRKLKYLSLDGCLLKVSPNINETLCITSSLHGDTVESKITSYSSMVQFLLKTPGASALNNPSSFMQNYIHRLDKYDHLHDLSGVTKLKLRRLNFKILEEELQKLGEFPYLMELCLSGWCMICYFSPVVLFLQKSPNLQKLTLNNRRRYCQRYCRGYCLGENTDVHQIVDNSMLLEFSRCKNLKMVHIKLRKDYIRADKVEEAWSLPKRKEFENIEIVLS